MTYSLSGSFGSTVTRSKYQPRPQMRASASARCQVAPASSERYRPPSLASMIAYTRSGLLGATATPILPTPAVGKPWPSCFHVAPPSVDLYRPLPGPLEGG